MSEVKIKPTYGEFKIIGKVIGTKSERFYQETKTKSGKSMRKLNFAIEFNHGTKMYVNLMGIQNEEVYTKLYSKDEAEESTYTMIKIPFSQRLTHPLIKNQEAQILGVTAGIVKDKDDKNIKTTMVEYDMCKYLADNLKENMSVFAIGSIGYYNNHGMTTMQFNLRHIYATSQIVDWDKEDFNPVCDIKQSFVYQSIAKSKDDFIIQGLVVEKNNIHEVTYTTDNPSLANTMRAKLKPYTHITATGSLITIKPDMEEQADEWGQSDPFDKVPAQTKFTILGVNSSSIDPESHTKELITEFADNLTEQKDTIKKAYGTTETQKKSKPTQEPAQQYAQVDDDDGLSDFDNALFEDDENTDDWDL